MITLQQCLNGITLASPFSLIVNKESCRNLATAANLAKLILMLAGEPSTRDCHTLVLEREICVVLEDEGVTFSWAKTAWCMWQMREMS